MCVWKIYVTVLEWNIEILFWPDYPALENLKAHSRKGTAAVCNYKQTASETNLPFLIGVQMLNMLKGSANTLYK